MTNTTKHIVVIGAGLAGLSASHNLIKQGFRVTLIDSEVNPGGLAKSIQIRQHQVEEFYHFLCRLDDDLMDLAEELKISHRLHWHPTKTSFYYNQKLYKFGSPFDLIGFSPIPILQRFRFGLHILYSRYRSQWKWLDQIPAKAWLVENIGEDAYFVIWHPLLKVKFGNYHDKISAAWVWHRIWRVAKSRKRLWEGEVFGYFEEGSSTVVDALFQWLGEQPGFCAQMNSRVQSIIVEENQVTGVQVNEKTLACDAVVSTLALPQLTDLLGPQTHAYFSKLKEIEYIGVVCALFVLDRQFSPYFWMNINDPRISFNGIIEETNLNQTWRKSSLNLLYIPYYLQTDEPRFQYSDEQLYQEYIAALKLIRPDFDETWIKDKYIFRSRYAQAICVTNFASLRPDPVTPIEGLYLSDSTQFYPQDRTLSAAVGQGKLIAAIIGKKFA